MGAVFGELSLCTAATGFGLSCATVDSIRTEKSAIRRFRNEAVVWWRKTSGFRKKKKTKCPFDLSKSTVWNRPVVMVGRDITKWTTSRSRNNWFFGGPCVLLYCIANNGNYRRRWSLYDIICVHGATTATIIIIVYTVVVGSMFLNRARGTDDLSCTSKRNKWKIRVPPCRRTTRVLCVRARGRRKKPSVFRGRN